MVYLCDSSINASSHLTLNYYYSQLCLCLCQRKLIVALMEGNSGLCGTIAIWISRRSNTYDPRNHWLTSWWLFLPHSNCGFVSRMLVRTLWHLNEQTNIFLQRVVHGTIIEIVWTIFPSVNPMFIWESQKENFECILLFLFSAIEISILDLLFQNFNFCFSSLSSYNPTPRTTFPPSGLPLHFFLLITLPPEIENPQDLCHAISIMLASISYFWKLRTSSLPYNWVIVMAAIHDM